MRRLLFALSILAIAGVASADEKDWLTSWEKASKLAKQTNKPVLADFTGSDWCNPCRALQSRVFDTPTFKSWAKDHVVLLRLDYPRYHPQPDALRKANQSMLRKYGVEGFPTILFLNPAGAVLGTYGFSGEGPSFWTKNAEIIIKSGAGRH